MKTDKDYIQDLTEIRSMMERSTRFLSLTGWSGIMAGVYALLGAALAYLLFFKENASISYLDFNPANSNDYLLPMLSIALSVLIMALATALFLSYKKARKNNIKLWNAAARRLLINLAIPLTTGGIFVMFLYLKGFMELIAPSMLIFYGLALLNASKFTFEEVRFFGIIEIILGLIAVWFTGYGLLFWAIGFGLLHIVYGIYMYQKYER